MANEDIKMLLQAIKDFAQWIKTVDEHGRYPQTIYHTQALNDFLSFAIINDVAWKDMFTLDTLKDFHKYSSFKNAPTALMALSGYLFSYGKIDVLNGYAYSGQGSEGFSIYRLHPPDSIKLVKTIFLKN